MDGFIKIIETTDELLREALSNGDVLTTPRESQMLINMQGVSINSKPRKDGRYQGYILSEGEKRYFYGRTREEVAEKIKTCIREGITRKKKKKKVPTFKEYTERWIELYKRKNLKPSSFSGMLQALKKPLMMIGEKPMDKITSEELQEMLSGLPGKRVQDHSILYVKQIFKKAFINDIIKKDPCISLEIKKTPKKHRRALTLEEQAIFVKSIKGDKMELLFLFLLSTGLRIGEALALTRDDFDQTKFTVKISKNVVYVNAKRIEQDTPKTAAGNREIPVNIDLMRAILATDENIVFPYSYAQCQRHLRKIALAAGIPVTLHVLRHTFATRMEEHGIPPKIKQYLMGHSTLSMTQNVYTDAQHDYVNTVSDTVRGLIGPENDTKKPPI